MNETRSTPVRALALALRFLDCGPIKTIGPSLGMTDRRKEGGVAP